MRPTKPKIASLVWGVSGLHEAQASAVRALGYQHETFLFNEPIPPETDIVLVQGPFGSLLPLTRQLVGRRSRPVLAYWFEESFHHLHPAWLVSHLARPFSALYRHHGDLGLFGRSLAAAAPDLVSKRGRKLAFLGDILWLYRNDFLDVLALSSTVYSDYFKAQGIEPVLVPRGYHPSYGEILNRQRDIAVVWMGKTRTARRRRAVYGLRDKLKEHGHRMLIHDNQERPFIFRSERTQVLNRAWFVLNVLTHPKDELSIRYYFGAANGAVVLTEPGENEYPFVPGRHLVECPVARMPDKVIYYLSHQEEWRAISTNMLNLMQEELTLEQSIVAILSAAERELGSGHK